MVAMVTPREGYRTLFVQIPQPVWDALAAEADKSYDGSLTKAISTILRERYRIAAAKMPPPRRVGRPRKK